MELRQFIPIEQRILDTAAEIKSAFPTSDCNCEHMAEKLVAALKAEKIRAEHVMGIFTLDKPYAWKYRSDEDEDFDDYEVNHDWVNVEGKILDISADQFAKYVDQKIPDIVFINYTSPLYKYYKELGYA